MMKNRKAARPDSPECRKARAFVEAWESGGFDDSEAPRDFNEFRAHLSTCRECSRRFGALLPLMQRDFTVAAVAATVGATVVAKDAVAATVVAKNAVVATVGATTVATDLADDVMAAIAAADSAPRLRHRRPLGMMAAAAAAIFVLGLGLGVLFGPRNSNTVTVRFVLSAPQAASVRLAGDFNDWNGEGYELRRSAPGSTWEISVPLKKNRVYTYNFILDGETWIDDPAVSTKIDDGFGGSSSLLRL